MRSIPPETEDSWLLKLIEPRSIGFFIFAASIFAIEFNEMWAVDVPRTVALSKFDILSSSIANIPVLLIAILIAALLIAVTTMIALFGLGGLKALFSLCAMIFLGVLDFVLSATRWVFETISAQFSAPRDAPIEPPSFGVVHLFQTERFKEAAKTIKESWRSVLGQSAKAWSIVGHQHRRGSWEQIAQILLTVLVFLVIWAFSWFSADHYRERIYDFKRVDVKATCGPTSSPSFPSLSYLFEFFQPLNAGYLVLTKDFTARSTLIKRVNGGSVMETEVVEGKTAPLVVTGCVTYVGDYGDWAFIVPRHSVKPKGGFLIRRSMIQEFTPIAPEGPDSDTGSDGLGYKSPQEVIAGIVKDVADIRQALNSGASGLYPSQEQLAALPAIADLRESISTLNSRLDENGGVSAALAGLIAENGRAISDLRVELAALSAELAAGTAAADRLDAIEDAMDDLRDDLADLASDADQLSVSLLDDMSTMSGRLDENGKAISSLQENVTQMDVRLTAGLNEGLAGQQVTIDALSGRIDELSIAVADIAKRMVVGEPGPEAAELSQLQIDVETLTRNLSDLKAVIAPLPLEIEDLGKVVGGAATVQDLSVLTDGIGELRADLVALKATVATLEQPDRWEAFHRLLGEVEGRLSQIEVEPTIIVIDGQNQGGRFGPFSPFEDQYSGIPTRLVDAIDQVKGLGGDLSECYKTGDSSGHIDFARNVVVVDDEAAKLKLLAAVKDDLDLPNRNTQSPAKLVFVKGGADSLGTPEVNRRISEQRAASVQRAIEDHFGRQLDGKNIEIVSVGIGENVSILDPDKSIGPRAVKVIVCDVAGE